MAARKRGRHWRRAQSAACRLRPGTAKARPGAAVHPDDLEPDSLGDVPTEYRDEEIISEKVITPGPLKLSVEMPKSNRLFLGDEKAKSSIEVEDRAWCSARPENGYPGAANPRSKSSSLPPPASTRRRASWAEPQRAEISSAAQLSSVSSKTFILGSS